MSDDLMMAARCCQDCTELVYTECGRQFKVCTNCDSGINDCTEGLCDHPADVDQCPGDYCEFGPGYPRVCHTHERRRR